MIAPYDLPNHVYPVLCVRGMLTPFVMVELIYSLDDKPLEKLTFIKSLWDAGYRVAAECENGRCLILELLQLH